MTDTINRNDIKEVSLASTFAGFIAPREEEYTDLLRISKHWSSYRRLHFADKEPMGEWSYQTTDPSRNKDWEELVSSAMYAFQKPKEDWCVSEGPYFNLRVTFKDGSHIDRGYPGFFRDNKLDHLSRRFKKLIPSEEILYPDVLDFIPLYCPMEFGGTLDLKRFDPEKMCMFMILERGYGEDWLCMDEDGHKLLVGPSIPGQEDEEAEKNIWKTYFRHDEFSPDVFPIGWVEINDRRWIFVYLGLRCAVYLREDFWKEHGSRVPLSFGKTEYEERMKWFKFIRYDEEKVCEWHSFGRRGE